MAILQTMSTQSSLYTKKVLQLDSTISFQTLIKITIGQAITLQTLSSRKYARTFLVL